MGKLAEDLCPGRKDKTLTSLPAPRSQQQEVEQYRVLHSPFLLSPTVTFYKKLVDKQKLAKII